MMESITRLLTEAAAAKNVRAYWETVARLLSARAGRAGVGVMYRGVNEAGAVTAGAAGQAGVAIEVRWEEGELRAQAAFTSVPPGVTKAELQSSLEVASQLAIMVGRRAELERERRLGSFLIELSRWLLATPDRDLLLRYTMHSLMSLVGAEGAYVALREPQAEELRVVIALGLAEDKKGMTQPLTMALVDPYGRVLQRYAAGRAVFGLTEPEAHAGTTLQELGLSASAVAFRDVLARASFHPPWHGRVVVVPPSGDRRVCDCTVTVLSGLGSDHILVALYDRTDELRAQRELIAREKLATVGEIASGVAHEVNNPLAAIRMEAELLKRGTRDAETEAAASTSVREVDRAARIVRSLLRLARRADTDPTRVQVHDLVRDVAEIRERVLRADNVEVRTRLDLSVPPVLGLGQDLQQVVINLVTNAEHAVRGLKPAVIQLTTQAREGWVRFTVEDSGPGVPKDIRGRIFDP